MDGMTPTIVLLITPKLHHNRDRQRLMSHDEPAAPGARGATMRTGSVLVIPGNRMVRNDPAEGRLRSNKHFRQRSDLRRHSERCRGAIT